MGVFLIALMRLTAVAIEFYKGKVLNKALMTDDIKDMIPDQDLDSYFSVLKDKACESWLREEIVCVHRIGITRLNDQSY